MSRSSPSVHRSRKNFSASAEVSRRRIASISASVSSVRQLSAAIAAAGVARIEVAGGLRSAADVAAAFAVGADRVVVGTRAIADPSFAADLVSRYGAPMIVGALDVRDGAAVGHGWRDGAPGIK